MILGLCHISLLDLLRASVIDNQDQDVVSNKFFSVSLIVTVIAGVALFSVIHRTSCGFTSTFQGREIVLVRNGIS